MSHRDNPDRVCEFTVEHDVGETPDDAVSKHRVLVQCATLRILFNTPDGGFDFSLQIPAVALLYAVMLGLGVGQAFSTRA